MKISLQWLQDFVTLRVTDPAEIARRVTAGVAEVDDTEILGGLLDRCCVGKILSVRKHPNADRLNLCEVQSDQGVKKIVCGGINLRVGMKVALAHIGARVRWHGEEMVTLEKTKIRGEESEGMICTSAELDIASRFPMTDERAVLDLGDGDAGVGESLKDYLGMDDVVLHIDNHAITHRADLFSHIGFAREFVALGLATWKKKRTLPGTHAVTFTKEKLPIQCIVDRKDLVPRYESCLITIDSLGETPKWMRTRLEATGWRCVSLPVDITNYVAMETGMPLHSFDADDIRGDFHMRAAKEGEIIVTLDGVKRVLPEGAIVLSDKEGIFDLLGIMGGLRSSTKESTKHIYLHSAVADPASIRKAIIATGHRTDASTVYEKGIPRASVHLGLMRAIELMLSLVPGARISSSLVDWGDDGKPKPITLPLERVSSMLGTDIPEKKIIQILTDLEFTVKKGKEKSLTVTAPLHRLGDIRGAHDLIEEVGRVYGYNAIPTALPSANTDPPKRDMRTHRLRDALCAGGYSELVPISLTGPVALQRAGLSPSDAVEIRNPISDELKLLHTSTLPGLLEHAQQNVLLVSGMLKTFTISRVFKKGQPEHPELGMLFAPLLKSAAHRELLDNAFLQLKTDLHSALAQMGYQCDVAVAGSCPSSAHPGRYAELLVRSMPSSQDAPSHPFTPVGRIFELHPSIIAQWSLPARTAVVLVDLSALYAVTPAVAVARAVPQFPSVAYDVTITGRTAREQTGEILRRLRGSHEFLESVDVKDLYATKSDAYNLTLTFTYRSKDRTLTEDEVKPIHEKILQSV